MEWQNNYFETGNVSLHKTIGDTAVVYTEGYNQTETKYSVIAQFPFDDAVYFFWMEWSATPKGSERDMIWDTLERMLEPSKSPGR